MMPLALGRAAMRICWPLFQHLSNHGAAPITQDWSAATFDVGDREEGASVEQPTPPPGKEDGGSPPQA